MSDGRSADPGSPLQTGTVEAVADGVARVRLDRPAQCGGCHACGLGRAGGMVAELDALPGLKPGDRVRVALDPRGVWRGTFWIFVLPLAALVAGAVVGYRVKWLHRVLGLAPDVVSGLVGFVLMGTAFGLGMLRNRRLERDPACKPRIVARL